MFVKDVAVQSGEFFETQCSLCNAGAGLLICIRVR